MKTIRGIMMAAGFCLALAGCMREDGGSDWKVSVGDDVPQFSLKDVNGESFSPEKLAGKPYVLGVFGTWCPPCKEELIAMESGVWQPLKDSGIKVIAVNFGDEDAATIKHFMDENSLTYTALVDEGGTLRKELGVEMVPQSVVVGPDGKILDLHVGYTEEAIAEIKSELVKAAR